MSLDQVKDIQILFEKYDRNKDRKITFAEVFKSLKEGGSKDPFKMANQIFAELDKNEDGVVDIKEVSKHTNYGNQEYLSIIKDDMARFLKFFDKDGDQMLNYQEVVDVYRNKKAKNPEYLADKLFLSFDKDQR
ncbi:calcium-binding protein [Cavenderia fasciculata]|uniref:Calcium-binding protein n=1 Tax=Cavenderia fasciculata TaxID=261658 RepID=F4Q3M6_CACFS|nr:calcium-binding protein [Cavenderia fasciculata]EGG17684.1 calcium-binding protein [Cavenderia fasciculata]|eukprot:XP_004356168.1 calcium-binding protein [Cavenderia fasciculata]